MSGLSGVRACFDRWYRPLVRSLRARLGDADLAEDIAQEAFVRLLAHRPRDPKAWLFTVASNLVRDHARAASGRARHLALVREAHAPAAGDADPSALLLRAEAVAGVRAALDRLTERDRSLLLLHHGGFSYAEIAARLAVAPSSVGPLLTRAQRRFTRAYDAPATAAEANGARDTSG